MTAELLTLKVSPGTLDTLNEAAGERGITRSELVRTALQTSLEAPAGLVRLRVVHEAVIAETQALEGLLAILSTGSTRQSEKLALDAFRMLVPYLPEPVRVEAKKRGIKTTAKGLELSRRIEKLIDA